MFQNTINKFREICCKNQHQHHNHVACLLKGRKKVISYSLNDYRRQYVSRAITSNIHAEVSCLKNILTKDKKIKKNLILLILRFKKDGTLCDSKPCAECKKYLLSNNILSVFCSLSDGSIQKIFLKDLPNYLSSAQIQFKIFGLSNVRQEHLQILINMGLNMAILQKRGLKERLEILKNIKQDVKEISKNDQ